jgi:hypothetical protein
MSHPRSASRYPLKGAALAVRQSRPGCALGATLACTGIALRLSQKST